MLRSVVGFFVIVASAGCKKHEPAMTASSQPPAQSSSVQLGEPTLMATVVASDPGDLRSRLGFGYSSATGRILGTKCVTSDKTIAEPPQGGELGWEWTEDSAYTETESNSDRSVVGNAFYDTAKLDGYNIQLDRLSASSYAHTVIGRLEVRYPGPSLPAENLRLTEEARAWSADPVQFYMRCGDRYVSESITGAALLVMASLRGGSRQEVTDLKQKLTATFEGEFGGSATVENKEYLRQLHKSGRLTISVRIAGPASSFSLASQDQANLKALTEAKNPSIEEIVPIRNYAVTKFPPATGTPAGQTPISYRTVVYGATLRAPSPPNATPLADAVARLHRIDQYLADLDVIAGADRRSSGSFFGPVNKKRLADHRAIWKAHGRELNAAIRGCDVTRTFDCITKPLAKIPDLPPTPAPGRVIAFEATASPTAIALRVPHVTVLVDEGQFRHPVTILAKGEWSQLYKEGHTSAKCGDQVAPALRFQSMGQVLSVKQPDEISAITTVPVLGPLGAPNGLHGPDAFAIRNWPATRRVTATLGDAIAEFAVGCEGTGAHYEDPPYVLVWEQNPNFSASDPFQALEYLQY